MQELKAIVRAESYC